jgi:hypothetical protein
MRREQIYLEWWSVIPHWSKRPLGHATWKRLASVLLREAVGQKIIPTAAENNTHSGIKMTDLI